MGIKLKNQDSSLLDKINILIVEDDDDSREVLEIFLSGLGANVKSRRSARSAVNLLTDSNRGQPDVIISDIGMPDDDGYALMEKLRRDTRLEAIPAIALSAFSSRHNRRKALESGFQLYHSKPFDPDRLTEQILELVNSN